MEAENEFYIRLCDTPLSFQLAYSRWTEYDDNKSKVAFITLSPSAIEVSHNGLMRQFEMFTIITQPIALIFVAACLVSGRVVSVNLIPRQANQRLSMARYAAGTATEICPQWDSNPVLTSTSQQVASMGFINH